MSNVKEEIRGPMGQNNLHLADYYLPGYGILYEWKIIKIKA